jgi:hypothetical protein
VTDHVLRLTRLDGGELVLDGSGLTRLFFGIDPSSVGLGAYDSLSGRGRSDRIEIRDIEALNRTMRARTPHSAWAELIDRNLDWLREIPPDLDLVATDDEVWDAARGEALIRAAIRSTIGRGRGLSVATKLLHLKRPRLFPVLDALVAQLLGQPNVPEDPDIRADQAVRLVLHLRREGRRNRTALQAIQTQLAVDGYERSLVRILDAALWLSHPAAGGPAATRRFTVELMPGTP